MQKWLKVELHNLCSSLNIASVNKLKGWYGMGRNRQAMETQDLHAKYWLPDLMEVCHFGHQKFNERIVIKHIFGNDLWGPF